MASGSAVFIIPADSWVRVYFADGVENMRKGLRASTVSALAMAVGGFGLAGCGLKPLPPFDPLAIQRTERIPSREAPPTSMPTLPTTLEEAPGPSSGPGSQPTSPQGYGPEVPGGAARSRPGEVIVRMPLQDVIQRSVLHSNEVRVAGYDPAVAKTRVLEAQARYDPVFFVNGKYEHQDQPFAGQVIQNPLSITTTTTLFVERGEVYTGEAGIKQLLPTGGQIQLSYQSQYNYLLPRRFILNPYWDDQLKFQLTQPLLRDFGYQVNQAKVTIARNDYRVSVLDFRKALEDNVAELEKDYWQLQEAEQEVQIQVDLLKQSNSMYEILVGRAKAGGDVSRVQIRQAQSSIDTRETTLIRAKARIRDVSDDIKRRMNDPDFPVAGNVVVFPFDPPSETKIEFLVADQVNTAVNNRLELGQQLLRINDAAVAEEVARNAVQPKLDLVASFTLEGLAESTHRTTQGTNGLVGQNAGDAFHDQWGKAAHTGWSLGFNFELPLGNREARSVHRRAWLQYEQAIAQYQNLVSQVTLDVVQAVREVETTWNEMNGRRKARLANADELAALEDRRANGEPLTPTFVQLELDSQERLAEARRQEALAAASYNVAIARLERAKGTLLRYNNVILDEERFMGMER
ncbi:MAG: putative efflux system outer membrane protein [Phycisphaerales bacterium]|nr:putative efflux system outer membrane protein [Phycisphaerales bacterium]